MPVKIKSCIKNKGNETLAKVEIGDELYELLVSGTEDEVQKRIDEETYVELDFSQVVQFNRCRVTDDECGYFKTNKRDVIGLRGQIRNVVPGGHDVIYDLYVGEATSCLCLVSSDIGARSLREGDGLEVLVRNLVLFPVDY